MRDKIPEEEILKWLAKIKKELKDVKAKNEKGEEYLKNINAYVNDCEHFLKQHDLVVAWELISFAWGLLEGGLSLEVLKSCRSPKNPMSVSTKFLD